MTLKSLSSLFVFVIAISAASVSHAVNWKGVFIAGDDSIENFDNGREDLTKAFSEKGNLIATAQFSSSENYIDETEGVFPATAEAIIPTFSQIALKSDEGCFIHMTSHGQKNGGFYMAKGNGMNPPQPAILTPTNLETLINTSCGTAPTVILISACYSGQFITDALKGPNRIIMTAARADRPSFGCSADTEYTYWDGCLLESLPNSTTWVDLNKNVNACITKKEAAIGAQPSEPQSYFGANTADWEILH